MQFAAIHGYESIKQRLIRLITTQQVPHAQLFWGPEGSASLPLALAFATYLYCQKRSPEDACGQCTSCRQMAQYTHPDLHFIFPTGATKQLSSKEALSANLLKTWRKFLQQQPYGNSSDWYYHLGSESKQLSIAREEARQIASSISLKPFAGTYTIVLIWLPEYLHAVAANALLKVLEEPPSQTLFLLVSFQHQKILGTIRSRTQQVHIPPFTDHALKRTLEPYLATSQQELDPIVLLANGNFNRALKLAESTTATYFTQFRDWMRGCYTQNLSQLVAQANSFHGMPREGQKNFITYALHMLREALMATYGQATLARAEHSELAFIQKFGSTMTLSQMKAYIFWINQAHYQLERNVHPKILYLDLSLRIAHAYRQSINPEKDGNKEAA